MCCKTYLGIENMHSQPSIDYCSLAAFLIRVTFPVVVQMLNWQEDIDIFRIWTVGLISWQHWAYMTEEQFSGSFWIS